MSPGPFPLRALVEAARRARLLDPAAGARLLAAAPAAVAGGDGLAAWLPASGAVGPQLARKLQALLPPPGLCFGRFAAYARIGQRGEVDAWLAGDGEALVLVRCLAAGGADPEARQRFAREADCARRLRHPHIVPCLDVGTAADGSPYLVFEYLENGDLGDLVQVRGGRLAPRHALSLLLQATDGLSEAHRLGLVHRDLSPEAVLVDPIGTAKLFGFGLAAAAAGDMTQLTLAGSRAGGTLYHAPEQVLGVGHVDVRADIYALGGLLVFCLTGQPPFAGRPPEVMHAKLSGRTPDLRALRPEAGEAAAEVVATCLARDPAQRYPDPAALSAALLQARLRLVGDGPAGGTSTNADGARSGTTSVTRRRQLALAGTLADMPIGDVLQAMQRLRATGVLRLVDERGDRGLVVQAGLPVALAFDHPDDVLGLVERLVDRVRIDRDATAAALAAGEAPAAALERLAANPAVAAALPGALAAQLFDEVCRRFGDGDGSFELLDAEADADTAAAVERGRRHAVRLNPDHLLAEAARQLDEGVRLRRRVPGGWALPAVVPERAEALRAEHVAFPERAILAAIDGRTAVRDLPVRAHASPFSVHRLLAAAIPSGSLRVPDADETTAAAATLVADGDIAGAEPLLRAALAERPEHQAASALWAACIARSELPTAVRRTHAPSAAVLGDPADAFAGGWLALLSSPDGTGPAVHLLAGDEVTLGKSAREPVRISLRRYPVETNVDACQQISRAHCRIEAVGGATAVRHLGGGNGTRLDGQMLVADQPVPLVGEHLLDVAGVVQLRVRRLELDADPPLPAAAPAQGLAAVAIRRAGNREDLAYALVSCRIGIGGAGADLPLPGLPAGRHLALARWDGRWWWSAEAPATWRPLILGAVLPCAGLGLVATAGDPRFYG